MTHAEAAKKHEIFGLITEIRDLLDKIGEIVQAAEHNKRICKALKQRIYVMYLAILDLKVHGDDKECFNENRQYLQNLVDVIKKIKEFVVDISQMTTLLKSNYNQPKNIEKTFKELCKEFDDCIIGVSSKFNTTIKNKIYPKEEAEALKADQDELNKNVTKWVNVKNEDEEYAFKSISERDKRSVQNQVTILRELHDWQNIIKFYGLTNDGNKWYSVTEWAEHGNLREFYTNNKNSFDTKLKLRVSLDIARGLNFLRTVEILHRDIRAENVLITLKNTKNTAKLTNFKLSRSYNADTLNQHHNLEQIRYCAPEMLERIPGFKYNNKCEVYSFGILLWEISEEKTPYENHDDFVEITRLVLDKYREPFSENSQKMPDEFKNLALDAVNHDPEFRPKITTMFEILSNCFKSFENSSNMPLQDKKNVLPKHVPKLPDFESF
ncbi:kinase-like domain-containing protein, partial [Rhizophagus irregularis DAOM 181602=DAOM 197198]